MSNLPEWTPPAYRYKDGATVLVHEGGDQWSRVRIISRSLVLDLDGRLVPVYTVEDKRGTFWLVGEGEMRRI